MEKREIYEEIALRTDGDIYIGVVGPVRTGKSTFIKRFMETLVIPGIDNVYRRERARDELPQSGAGRTVMTAEPKFVPEEAAEIRLDGGGALSVRLVDCVGYLVEGAVGQQEDGAPRMVTTPWFDHEIPMTEAAEVGTRKVIAEHSTIGVVVTTDGSITEIPRRAYLEAEERVIRELKELGKPFVVLLNCEEPDAPAARALQEELAKKYDVACFAVNCLTLEEDKIAEILRGVLYEFPLRELRLTLPPWVDALPRDHPVKAALYAAIRDGAASMGRIRDVENGIKAIAACETVGEARLTRMELGSGGGEAVISVPRALFYTTLTEQSGFAVADDGDLMELLTQLAGMKREYAKVADALQQVRQTGYGVVMPTVDELVLEEPELMRQGGRYGVRLRASAPSIHMLRADIQTVISPVVGSEKQSADMVEYLLREFETDPKQIWESNIFGKSFHDLVSEDLNGKLKRMPEEAREKLRETLQRIINEGSGGLICIIL